MLRKALDEPTLLLRTRLLEVDKPEADDDARTQRYTDRRLRLEQDYALRKSRLQLGHEAATAATAALDGELGVKQVELARAEAAERAVVMEAHANAYIAEHTCGICLNVFARLGVALPCGHRTCAACMLGLHLNANHRCPQCRTPWSMAHVRDICASIRS